MKKKKSNYNFKLISFISGLVIVAVSVFVYLKQSKQADIYDLCKGGKLIISENPIKLENGNAGYEIICTR